MTEQDYRAGVIDTVRNGLTPVPPFRGVQIAAISTESREPRWLELALYRVTEEDATGNITLGDYYLHMIGKTVVYHLPDSACNKGVTASSDELPEDAEPCLVCRPPALTAIADDELVDLEADRHTAFRCVTAVEVMDKLAAAPGKPPGKLSGPAQRLMGRAARVDDAIREAIETPTPL